MKSLNSQYDVIIIGAGAAGLMAAICAGKRGKKNTPYRALKQNW